MQIFLIRAIKIILIFKASYHIHMNRIRLNGPKTDPSQTPTFLEILCYICNIVLLEISMMMLQKVWDDGGFYQKIMRMHV